MTTVTKYTTPHAAGDTAHTRATLHQTVRGGTYQEALRFVLAADPELATAYAVPAPRSRGRAPAPGPVQAPGKPKPVADDGDSQEGVRDLLAKALADGQTDALPGTLGELAAEAKKLVDGGLKPELAAAWVIKMWPEKAEAAGKELGDMKAEAPAHAQGAGAVVHARAERLTEAHQGVSYQEAVHRVLEADTALKAAYTGVRS